MITITLHVMCMITVKAVKVLPALQLNITRYF